MDILTVKNLHKAYGKGEGQVKALNGIDLYKRKKLQRERKKKWIF